MMGKAETEAEKKRLALSARAPHFMYYYWYNLAIPYRPPDNHPEKKVAAQPQVSRVHHRLPRVVATAGSFVPVQDPPPQKQNKTKQNTFLLPSFEKK